MTKEQIYKNAKDEELVLMAQNGDEAAQEYLLDKYKSLVRAKSRAYFLIGADSEDIIQEGMIGLFKAIKEYDPEKASSFHGFADLCITRQMLTAIKSATRKKHSPLNNYVSVDQPKFEKGGIEALFDTVQNLRIVDPEEHLIGEEEYEQIITFLNENLSSLEKTVIGLYLNGYSYQQIAQKLNRSPKSIDNAIQRIKHKLEQRKS